MAVLPRWRLALIGLALGPLVLATEPEPRTDRFGDPLPAGAVARLGTVRLRHNGDVLCVVFSADGKTLISFGKDDTIRVWDVSTGKQLRQRKCSGDAADSPLRAALSPDGKYLAVERATDLVGAARGVIYDARTGKPVQSFEGAAEAWQRRALSFSPHSKLLAVEGANGTAGLWEVASGKQLRVLTVATNHVRTLVFAPNGAILAGGEEDGGLQFWETATGKVLWKLAGKGPRQALVAFAPDGKIMATVSGDKVVRLRTERGKAIRELQLLPDRKSADRDRTDFNSVAFAPDGGTVVARTCEGTVLVWEAATGKLRHHFEAHRTIPATKTPELAFSSGGKLLATWGDQRAIRLWDLSTGKEQIAADLHQDAVIGVALTPDGRGAASSSADGDLAFWDVSRARQVWRQPLGKWFGPEPLLLSPDGKTLAAGEVDGPLSLWRATTGTRIGSIESGAKQQQGAAFSPDGRTLACVDSQGIQLRDITTGTLGPSWGSRADHVAYSASGSLLATGRSGEAEIRLWELPSRKEVPVFKETQAFVRSLVFSPDDRTLLARTAGDGVCLWEVATGRERWHSRGWICTCFAPDSRIIALGDSAGEVVLWDVAAESEVRRFRGHRGRVLSLAFSADGRRLISGSADSTALVWDVTGVLPLRQREKRLSARDLAAAWKGLGSEDAAGAFRAVCALAAAPQQVVPFVRERLRPLVMEAQQVQRWLADLDHPRFAIRRRAEERLEGLGRSAGPALRHLLRGRPSLEVRRRAERLLDRLEQEGMPPTPILRGIRAVEVLEMTATSESRKLLRELATGAADARLTQEAKRAFERLTRARASR